MAEAGDYKTKNSQVKGKERREEKRRSGWEELTAGPGLPFTATSTQQFPAYKYLQLQLGGVFVLRICLFIFQNWNHQLALNLQ